MNYYYYYHSLSPNQQFLQRIWNVEYWSVHSHMARSHKFRKSEISLDTGDSASNGVVKCSVLSVFINQRCADCVCLYNGLSVCRQNYIIIVCDCLRKSCTTVKISTMTSSWNFMNLRPHHLPFERAGGNTLPCPVLRRPSGKNRYGLVWAVMINLPELPIIEDARNDAHIASTGVRLY